MLRALAFAAALSVSTSAFAGGIAVVDFQRAVNETEEGKQAQTKLDAMYSSRLGELKKLEDELKAEYEDYKNRALVLSDAQKMEEEKKIGMKEQRFLQLNQQYEAEMQQTYYTMLQDLDVKMRTISEKLAKEKGYDLVLDRAAVVYMGGTTIDMTEELVKRYNAAQK
ncbi:MAG: OmpH family outer membrane protein [Alphaproteobacteria bacterium]|nr:OmpH family outer membrane protein [Alphaproteobacteria bacterium]